MRALVISFALPACMFSAIEKQNAAAKAQYERQQASLPHAMYVTADRTWLCPTSEVSDNCAGGIEVQKNHGIQVKGPAPLAGIWRVWYLDASGEKELYTSAAALNELPDTEALNSYAADVARRFPEPKRIPLRDINFTSLLEQPRAYRGYYLVIRQPASDMTNTAFTNGVFHFTVPIPVSTGSRWLALAQFEIKNDALRDRAYACGAKFCDEIVLVAELTGRTVDRVDELGTVRRLPVFAIRELGDRFGTYRSP
jgi:hypothetical protein